MAQFKTGTYTGDGNATQAISGVGFQPTYLVVYAQASNVAPRVIKTDQDGLNVTYDTGGFTASFQYETDHVTSFGADGFTVGDGTGSVTGNICNILNQVYTYIAMASQGSTSIKTGTYTGNGAATQGITLVGFQPKLVFISRNANKANQQTYVYKTDQDSIYACIIQYGGFYDYYIDDMIVSLDADGFTVGAGSTYPWGNSTNENGVGYTYLCMA